MLALKADVGPSPAAANTAARSIFPLRKRRRTPERQRDGTANWLGHYNLIWVDSVSNNHDPCNWRIGSFAPLGAFHYAGKHLYRTFNNRSMFG